MMPLAALHAGEYTLVKASIAGAIVTNSLFMLGASFLLVGNRRGGTRASITVSTKRRLSRLQFLLQAIVPIGTAPAVR